MPNITVGGNMYGLVHYLQGVGRENEHKTPHLVGGTDFAMVWFGNDELEKSSVKQIADYLEQPRVHFGVKVTEATRRTVTSSAGGPAGGPAGESGPDLFGEGEQPASVGVAGEGPSDRGYRESHVWHCSLSVPPGEGPLGDEKWQAIASDFMDEMGFTDASGKAPCRWVAVHHGASKNGNDHIHLAASRVREDGTKWDGRGRDKIRSQEVCHELEKKHGLQVVRDSYSARGEQYAELAQQARLEMPATAPAELGHRLRAAAVASGSEAEWIRRARADGVVLKPFYAKGSTTEVRGYKAALKPAEYNEKLVFYAGGKLGRDLSLPRLREMWPEATDPTGEAAQAATAEWTAAFKGAGPAQVDGTETKRISERAPALAAGDLAGFNARLASVPAHDREAWADAARDVSGALSAWARFDPDNAVELRAAASVVGRSAQVKRASLPPGRRVKESPMGTAFIFMAAKPEAKNKVAAGLLMRQLVNTVKALRDQHVAVGELRQARALEAGALARLERVQLIGYRPSEARNDELEHEQSEQSLQLGEPGVELEHAGGVARVDSSTTAAPTTEAPAAPGPSSTTSSPPDTRAQPAAAAGTVEDPELAVLAAKLRRARAAAAGKPGTRPKPGSGVDTGRDTSTTKNATKSTDTSRPTEPPRNPAHGTSREGEDYER